MYIDNLICIFLGCLRFFLLTLLPKQFAILLSMKRTRLCDELRTASMTLINATFKLISYFCAGPYVTLKSIIDIACYIGVLLFLLLLDFALFWHKALRSGIFSSSQKEGVNQFNKVFYV